MTIPMIVLSVFSVALGGVLSINGAFVHWLEPVLGHAEHGEPVLPVPVIMAATLFTVVVGVAWAWRLYVKQEVNQAVPAGNALVHAARNDLFQDNFNETVFMKPGLAITEGVMVTDRNVIDGSVRGVQALVKGVGALVSPTQNGKVRTYASYILAGVVALLAVALIGVL